MVLFRLIELRSPIDARILDDSNLLPCESPWKKRSRRLIDKKHGLGLLKQESSFDLGAEVVIKNVYKIRHASSVGGI